MTYSRLVVHSTFRHSLVQLTPAILRRAASVLTVAAIALGGTAAAQAPTRPFPGAHAFPAAHRAATPAASSTPQAATPQFSVAPGVYSGTQTISITDSTPGATIYYSADGYYPNTSSSNMQYSTPSTVSNSQIVTAIAVAPGYSNSALAVGRYIISTVPSSFVYTVAGNGNYGYAGDGGPAVAASIGSSSLVAVDSAGNVFIADDSNSVIRKVDAKTGIITTIAGNGTLGTSGDGGPATQAEIDRPERIAVDNSGNVYEAETSGVIRMISASTGQISTYTASLSGEDITGMAFDHANNLYVNIGFQIDEFAASTGKMSTLPQVGGWWTGLAIDSRGFVYFATWDTVEQLNPYTGDLTIVAGGGSSTGDGGPATSANLSPSDVAFDSTGNMYILDSGSEVIRKVAPGTGIISTVGGSLFDGGVGGDGDPANTVGLYIQYDSSFAVSPSGTVYIGGIFPRVYEITPPALPPTTALPAPQFSVSAGTYANAQTVTVSSSAPNASIFITTDGSAPMTDTGGYYGAVNVSGSMTVSAVASAPGYLPSAPASAAYTITSPPNAIVSTVAGTGHFGISTSGGPALNVNLADPAWIVADSSGNLYFSDEENCVVWKLTSATGTLAIYAGTPMVNYSCSEGGDWGPATAAGIESPEGLALDPAGNLYIADYYAGRIRKVDASTGIITTYAGPGTQSGGLGDGGPATSAQIPWPESIATDAAGNLYIADPGHGRVRMVSASTGIISTIAGTGQSGPMGDGGPATSASMSPNTIQFDGNGDLFILDGEHERLREVDAKTGIISTVAGNGSYGTSGDGGPAVNAGVAVTQDIAIDASGNIYLSNYPSAIRKIDAKTGIISQAFGTGYNGYSGDGGAASAASLDNPHGMTFDASGNLYFADTGNGVIRKITFPPPAAAPTFTPAAGAYTGVQSVTLSSSTPNATLYYTTDGSTPDTTSTKYTGAITVGQSETITAIAVASGFAESAVSTAKYTITIPTPAIALTASVNPVFTQNPVTFTATLSSTYGTPTGTVNFLDGSTQIGSGTLSKGVATFTTSSLAVGAHSITAVYGGDANFTSVTSTALSETVNDFTFAPPSGGSTSATASWGGTATYTLTVTPPSGGSASAITFSITGLPTGATATFNPASVPANSGTTNVTLTIQLPASAAATPHGVSPFGGAPLVLGFVLLPLLGVRRFRRTLGGKMLLLALALVAIAGVGSTMGCGGGSSGSGGGSNQQPQTYTLTVTATAGSLSHTETLTLNVQ